MLIIRHDWIRKLISFYILIGIIVTCASQVPARIYHVDIQRGSDEFPGSEELPFRTIGRASVILEPGDTVLIHPGVYHEQILGGKSGTENNPIVYQGTDREKVILRGSVLVKDWWPSGKIWIKSNLKPITSVNAFVMVDQKHMLKRVESPTNMPPGTFHLDAFGTYYIRLEKDANPNIDHDIEVYELDFAFNSGNRWGGTAKKWIKLSNMTIEKYGTYAVSTDWRHPSDNSNWELEGLIVRYNNAEGIFHCLDDWFVHDCIFIRNRGHGCQLNGARIFFTKNYCAENEWFGPYEDGGCGILIGPDDTAHSCIVRDNLFENNGAVSGYGCGIYLEGRSHSNLIENNLIKGGTAAGVSFHGSSFNKVVNNILSNIAPNTRWKLAAAFVVGHSYEGPPTQSKGNLVAHNTVWNCPSPIVVLEPASIVASGELNRFVNNLFYRCTFLSQLPRFPAIIVEGNGWFDCPRGESSGKKKIRNWLKQIGGLNNKIGSDPLLRNPEGGDFRAQPQSPLLQGGVPLKELSRDKNREVRPTNQNPDIGAYQH